MLNRFANGVQNVSRNFYFSFKGKRLLLAITTGYKIPRHIAFRTELPKTNVGKILRRQLRDEKA